MNVLIDASNKPTIEKLLKKVGTDLDTANKQKYDQYSLVDNKAEKTNATPTLGTLFASKFVSGASPTNAFQEPSVQTIIHDNKNYYGYIKKRTAAGSGRVTVMIYLLTTLSPEIQTQIAEEVNKYYNQSEVGDDTTIDVLLSNLFNKL